MAALTKKRQTPDRAGDYGTYKVKGGVKCLEGGIAVLASGYCKPGVKASGLKMVGVFAETKDNSAGSDGDIKVRVLLLRGTREVKLTNDGTDTITQAHVGASAYILDDQTIGSVSTGATAAGIIQQVDADGVWISAS